MSEDQEILLVTETELYLQGIYDGQMDRAVRYPAFDSYRRGWVEGVESHA